MDKRSSHWLDSLAWVRKVYFSCQTKEEDAAERLLLNFERLYKNEDLITLSWALRDEYLKFKYQKK
jgi:hypothetical protein